MSDEQENHSPHGGPKDIEPKSPIEKSGQQDNSEIISSTSKNLNVASRKRSRTHLPVPPNRPPLLLPRREKVEPRLRKRWATKWRHRARLREPQSKLREIHSLRNDTKTLLWAMMFLIMRMVLLRRPPLRQQNLRPKRNQKIQFRRQSIWAKFYRRSSPLSKPK